MLVGLYPRVSTSEQAQHGYSIGEQIERMEKYCDAMGWKIYDTYTDAGFSGGSMERPGLQRMIRDVKKKKVDKIIVYKLDRLSRSQKDTLELIEDVFLANGVDFISISENFDTATPFGKAMIGILAVFAQLEREQIKERMTMGKIARGKKGYFMGGHSPIGYTYTDGKLIVDEFEAVLVRKVFEMAAQNESIKGIVRKMNLAGMTHKYGDWNTPTLYHLLRQRTYIGEIRMNGEWYKGQHEPILSKELFDSAQKVLDKRTENFSKDRRSGNLNSFLGGLLYCGKCLAKYTRSTKHYIIKGKSYHYVYYECYSRTQKSKQLIKDINCRNKHWNMDELDNIIFEEIRKLAVDPAYLAEITAGSPDSFDDQIKTIESYITKLDDQISKLMDLYSTSGIPLNILEEKIHRINDQRNKLEHEAERIQAENEERLTKAEIIGIASSFSDILDRGDFFEIRNVLTTLIDKIVLAGNDITIYWTFS